MPAGINSYLTSKQVAELHGVNLNTVSRQCRQGKIEGAVKIGNNWLIPDKIARQLSFDKESVPYSLRKH